MADPEFVIAEAIRTIERTLSRDEQRDALRTLAHDLDNQRGQVLNALAILDMEAARERFRCPCVRLNRDVGIWNMGDQVEARRNGLTFGLVSDCLSARKDCERCHGDGVPACLDHTDCLGDIGLGRACWAKANPIKRPIADATARDGTREHETP